MDFEMPTPESQVCFSVFAAAIMAFGSVAAIDAAMSADGGELSRAEKLAMGAIIACKTVDPEIFWSAWAIIKLCPENFEEGVLHGVNLAMGDLGNG